MIKISLISCGYSTKHSSKRPLPGGYSSDKAQKDSTKFVDTFWKWTEKPLGVELRSLLTFIQYKDVNLY